MLMNNLDTSLSDPRESDGAQLRSEDSFRRALEASSADELIEALIAHDTMSPEARNAP